MASTLSRGLRNAIFANLIVTCVALAFVSSALSVALAPLMASFGVSAALGQWVTSGYTLVLAVAMPLTAFLVTRFPTRRLYLTALVLLVASLVVAALAPTFEVLMAARVVQACANALVASMTQVGILTIFPAGRQGTAMGWFGFSQGATVVAAPVLGGLLVDAFGWRSVFVLVALACTASLVLAGLVMRDLLPTRTGPFDFASFVLSTLAFGGITLGLGNVVALGICSPVVLGGILLGVCAGVLFAKRQLDAREPLLDLRLLALRPFATSVVAGMLLYLVMMGSSAVLPLYVQIGLGESAAASGAVLLPGAVLMALAAPFAGRAYDRFGIRALAIAGGIVLLVGNAAMCLVDARTPLLVLAALNAVRCVAIGCLQMPLVTWGNNHLEAAFLPHGSAIMTSLRNVAGALGVAVFVGLLGPAAGVEGLVCAYAAMTVVAAGLLFALVLFARD